MKTIAIIIHARKDSTRCPNKHLRDLGDGNTLIDISVNTLKVPNDPVITLLKSYPVTFLTTVPPDLIISPFPFTPLKPKI